MAFIYNVAEVKDLGDIYQVNYVTTNNLAFISPGRHYIKISQSTANLIKENRAKGNPVSFAKGIPREILPEDLIISELDSLEKEKALATSELGNLLDEHLATISALDIFNFIIINNQLLDAGYIITDKNREEKYLEIIETENEELISKLEKYLESRDRISMVDAIYTKFNTFKQQLSDVQNKDEVINLKNQTISSISNP